MRPQRSYQRRLIEFIFDSFAIPLFYVLLIPSIARSNYNMASRDDSNENVASQQLNMIAGLYLCNLLYVFLSTAPQGATRFYEYMKAIGNGKVEKNTPWLIEDDFYQQAKKNPTFALSAFICSSAVVLLSQTPVFLILGASGAEEALNSLTHNNKTISDKEALGLGIGPMTTNHILYTYALIKLSFSIKGKLQDFHCAHLVKNTFNELQKNCSDFKTACTNIASLLFIKTFKYASLLYASTYVKAGLEHTHVIAPLSALHYLQTHDTVPTVYRVLFLWGTEMALLGSLKDPISKLSEDIQQLQSSGYKAWYMTYKFCLLSSTILPVLSIVPAYSIFIIGALSSTPIDDFIFNRLHQKGQRSINKSALKTRLVAHDVEQPSVILDEKTTDEILIRSDIVNHNRELNNSSGRGIFFPSTTSNNHSMQHHHLSPLMRTGIAACLVFAAMSCLSCIALTSSKSLDQNNITAVVPFVMDIVNFSRASEALTVTSNGITGIFTNMLGITGIVALLIGSQYAAHDDDTIEPAKDRHYDFAHN